MQPVTPAQDTEARRRTSSVLSRARQLAVGGACSERQARLLRSALFGLEAQLEEDPDLMFPAVHLAPLVYAGVHGAETPVALDLAAITALVFLGLDIMDDLADGDRPAHWEGWTAAEINLAAATLLCGIVPKAIAELAVAPLHGTTSPATRAG